MALGQSLKKHSCMETHGLPEKIWEKNKENNDNNNINKKKENET